MKKIKLMAHVVVGYPTLPETVVLVKTMLKAGADLVELQIPFSDPLADGSTIMKACEKSLENGSKVKDAFEIMKKLSSKTKVPLLFMSYYNTIFRYGTEKFIMDAKNAGCYGLIVPDMPINEEREEHFYKFCRKYNLNAIRVISPNSTLDRLKKNSVDSTGFVYATARQGITGAKENLSPDLKIFLQQVRKYFTIPIAVGFGISKREHLEKLKGFADIAVVGSAIIDVIDESGQSNMLKNVSNFIKELKMVE